MGRQVARRQRFSVHSLRVGLALLLASCAQAARFCSELARRHGVLAGKLRVGSVFCSQFARRRGVLDCRLRVDVSFLFKGSA